MMVLFFEYLLGIQFGFIEFVFVVKLFFYSLDVDEILFSLEQKCLKGVVEKSVDEDNDVIKMEFDKVEEEFQIIEVYLSGYCF